MRCNVEHGRARYIGVRNVSECGCIYILHESVLIDDKQGPVIPDGAVLDHGHVAIVQCQPMSIEPCRCDGVVLAANGVAHDHDPQIIGREAGMAERDKFGDCIIFAISGTVRERHQGRSPNVEFAVLCLIAHRPDRQVDCAIDLAEAGAALAGSRVIDDSQKLQRGRRCAALANWSWRARTHVGSSRPPTEPPAIGIVQPLLLRRSGIAIPRLLRVAKPLLEERVSTPGNLFYTSPIINVDYDNGTVTISGNPPPTGHFGIDDKMVIEVTHPDGSKATTAPRWR